MQLIGQESNKILIDKWITPPNFIIIQGERHSGKTYMVTYICDKFNLFYKQVNISIKDIRNLLNVMTPNSKTLYHLKNFDKASLRAKNALLKVAEETPEGNYIVITGGQQLKTLDSRARKIVMEPYTESEMKQYIINKFEKFEQIVSKLYMSGINSPAKLELYSRYESLESLLNYAYDIFTKLTYITPNTYVEMISRFEDRYKPIEGESYVNDYGEEVKEQLELDPCLLFYNILINLISTTINDNQYYSYKPILEILLKYKQKLLYEPTLRRKMLLFRTFYEIENVRK